MNIKTALKTAGKFVDDNLPTILSGLALVGLGASVVTAVKETPKAMWELDNEKHKKLFTASDEELEKIGAMHVDERPEDCTKLGYDGMVTVGKDDETTDIVLYHQKSVLTPWEKFKVLAPVYWPCALSTVATAGCIIGSNVISKKRYLGLAAVALSQTKKFEEYQDKVKDLFGEKKEEEVKKEIAKDTMMECPESIAKQYVPGQQYPMNFLGCWWVGTKEEVERAFDEWNREGLDEAMTAFDSDCSIELEDLIYILNRVTKEKFYIPSEVQFFYNHMSWNVTDGVVRPEFTLAETGNDIPGYVIATSRKPDNYV